MNHFCTRLAAIVVALAVPVVALAQAPAAPVLQASVAGQTVSASWTAVAGATSYRVEAGVTPAAMLAGYEMGPLTNFSLVAPQGLYYLRVLARNASGQGAPSNVVPVQVSSAQGPPPAPTNLTAAVNGTTVTISAQLPNASLTGLLLIVGSTPGGTQAVIPLPVGSQGSVPNVPPGVYYARLVAVNAGGSSPASNEVQIVVGPVACGPPAAPALSAQVSGQSVLLSWAAVSGAVGYRVDVSTTPGGSPLLSQPLGPQTTAVSHSGVTPGTYYVKVVVANACGFTATSAETTVTVGAPIPGSNRTPNPPPGQFLPLPDRSAVVNEIARQYAGDLQNSCVASGGNNTWLFRLVQRLRTEDTRWGLNWKRGRIGDMSQDILTYNAGSEADEGTRNIYVLDVIGGHCGGSPGGSWNNVTGQGGADAIWTLQPYTAAGFPR
ncbi:MAG: hypothetical protein ABI880_02330 [Acidobacteriota bacterium]